MRAITPNVLDDLRAQAAVVRQRMWCRMAATGGTATVVFDIDASLVEIHSENKDGTAATYKGGFGFHRASSSSGAVTGKEVVVT